MTTTQRPTMNDGETMVAYFDRLDAWKEQGDWFPASNGTETPVTTRSGVRLLYCYQPRSGRHAYLHMDSDVILTDEQARTYLGTY